MGRNFNCLTSETNALQTNKKKRGGKQPFSQKSTNCEQRTFFCLHDGIHLDISVNVEPVVFGGQYHRAIIHQRHIEALRMLHLGLEGRDERAILRKHGEIEVVVIVGNGDLARRVDAHADGVVGDSYKTENRCNF